MVHTRRLEVATVAGGDALSASGGFAARWLDYPGEQLVSQLLKLKLVVKELTDNIGDWMHIWNQLSLSDAQRRGYDKMVGQTTQLTYLTNPLRNNTVDSPCASSGNTPQTCELRRALPQTTLYVPLQFWFCRNPGLAIPLIALQYHEVKINLEFNTLDQCLWAVNTNTNGLPVFDTAAGCGEDPVVSGGGRADRAYNSCCLVSASLFIDYVFLDTDERRRMAQNPHEYLIEQLQFTGDESIGSTSNKIKLNFNHPCKELVWVVQPDEHVDYCSSFTEQENEKAGCWDAAAAGGACCGNSNLYSLMGAQPFNYTDATDQIPRSWGAYGNQSLVSDELLVTKSGNCCATISRLANPWSCQVACNTVDVLRSVSLAANAIGDVGVQAGALSLAVVAGQEKGQAVQDLAEDATEAEKEAAAQALLDAETAVALIQGKLLAAQALAAAFPFGAGEDDLGEDVPLNPTAPWAGEPFIGAGGNFNDKPNAQGEREGHRIALPPHGRGGDWFDTVADRDLGGGANRSSLAEKTNSSVSTAGTIVLGQTSRGMNCWGENPVVTAKLLLNGQDRFSERLGSYFDVVQPYQHHTANPSTGINVYSFALRPEEHQPSGTCNFSRIDNASLQLVVSANAVGGSSTSKVRVYATNYNVLRVMSGMGGLAYSN